MAEFDDKPDSLPKGFWSGLQWVPEAVPFEAVGIDNADGLDYSAWAILQLQKDSTLTATQRMLQRSRDYCKEFIAEHKAAWNTNDDNRLFKELKCSDMADTVNLDTLTPEKIAKTRKLALEYTYSTPSCPIWVQTHLQQCDVRSLYLCVSHILRSEQTGIPVDWDQVLDATEALKAKQFDEVEWDVRTGVLKPTARPEPLFSDLFKNGRNSKLPNATQSTSLAELRRSQPKPKFVKTHDGKYAIEPVKLKQPAAKADTFFEYNWDSIDSWTTKDVATGKPIIKLIEDLTDKELWDTLVWLVANVDQLHKFHCQLDCSEANRLPAGFWLASRVTFNSLVLSAISREFTFMPTEAAFLRAYMQNTPDKSVFVEAKPWQRPFAESAKLQDLGTNLEKRIDQTRNQQHTGRPARAIRKVE